MWTSSHIKRHIQALLPGKLFTTRDLLAYGSRAAVDQTLYRLVRCGVIRRLARGVFVLNDNSESIPGLPEIVATKAAAFGKHIFTSGTDAGRYLGILPKTTSGIVFYTNGSSSSFRCGAEVVRLKSAHPRMLCRRETLTGLVVRALLHLGRKRCNSSIISTVTAQLGRSEKEELRRFADLMPAWLSDIFNNRFQLPRRWTKRRWSVPEPFELATS